MCVESGIFTGRWEIGWEGPQASLPWTGWIFLRESARDAIHFCEHTTYYQERKGRHMFYLPSARPTGNRPGLLPAHLKKTLFKEAVRRDKLDQDKLVPLLCQSSKGICIHADHPRINPENPKRTRKNDCTQLLTQLKAAQGQNPVSLFPLWVFTETTGFCEFCKVYTLGDIPALRG